MKKHLTRALAALLALLMALSVLPLTLFATEIGEGAAIETGMPADGSYGTIYSCGGDYSYVIGYDIGEGNAPALAVEATEDGEAIQSLPEGTMVIKFVKTGDDYYFMVGNKYLVLKDIDSNNKEKLILCDSVEAGAKWTVIPDQAGMANAYNIKNAEYKWNGRYDVYLEQYNGQKFCGYSYNASNPQHFQFKFLGCSKDEDGRIGEVVEAVGLPENGDKVVIYNEAAPGVFGQPTAPDAPKPNLTVAAAEIKDDGTLPYENIADGALIFDVIVSGDYYTFKTGGKYLGMTENYQNDQGKTSNDESLILVDAENDYTKWTLSGINGGWLMKNKTAKWGSNGIVIEYFGDLFCGYSYYAGDDSKYAMNFYKVEDKYNCGYVVNPSVEIEEPAPAIGSDCTVKFTVNDLNELTEIKATYAINGGAETAVTPEMNGKDGSFVIPAAKLEGARTLTVRVSVKDSMNLSFAKSVTVDVSDEPLITGFSPAANSATGADKKPTISVNYANVGSNAKFSMTLDSKAVTATAKDGVLSYKPGSNLADGKHNVSVTITRTDDKSVTKNWSFFVGENGETLYFGQIHAHTAEYSDGAGTLEQAYEHAHEVANLDYIVITDHSNYFDTTKTATTSSYYDLSSLTMNAAGTLTKWEEARATAKYYDDLWADFVCMYGYEMTWSGGPGHTNSFNTYGTMSRNNAALNNKASWAGMHLYNDMIVNADKGLDINGAEASTTRYNYSTEYKGGSVEVKRVGEATAVTGVNATKYIPFDENGDPVPVVSQFNHPGITFGNFGNFTGYTAKRDDTLNLVEVGNGEGKVGGSSYFPSYSEYDLCLSMGWHIGPTNNQDNHKGNWGDSNTCRDVVLTDDFSEIGIYRALDARRIYATEDQNLEIYYELKVGDKWYKLGDIASVSEGKTPSTVTAKITVNEPDSKEKVSTVEIIGENGKVIEKATPSGNSWTKEIEIPNDNAYYYIRVTEGDGDIAVTAPVWTKDSVPAAVEVKTDAAVAQQGKQEIITASFTNGSETESVKLTYYKVICERTVKQEDKDDKIVTTTIEEGKLSQTVKAGATIDYKIPFTPPKDGDKVKYKIKATFKFSYKGTSYEFSQTLEETAYAASKMTYIGLDSGHKNFYVSGDYANCDTSFIQICADNGIICEYIKEGQMTSANLKKYKLVVLSTPRISESEKPPVWTDAELSALASYVKSGGSIINLSKSDRYDYSEAGEASDVNKYGSANISNLVNAAIGAKARFLPGIVVDNDRKSNEAYRINFGGADLLDDSHPFTKAIYSATNGEYQWYNGTGITPNGATVLVKPYESTWVASYRANFDGSAYIPDYEQDTVVAEKGTFGLVTYEKLSGGGFLVCGGAAFISTYDLKTGTAAALQYENYQMVLNILEYVKNGNKVVNPTITPIADVHKGKENKEFTIEGWITSNASDYDKDTAFFDCVYIQDDTRGINAFPVSGYYHIGQKVQAHGGVTYYCGEIELNLREQFDGYLKIISNEERIIEPKYVTCRKAMEKDSIGNLMKISGVVDSVHRTEGVVDYVYVKDGSGVLGVLFINNYIQKESHALDDIEKGMAVTGIGIGSRDADETSGKDERTSYIKRLRVRSRDEIIARWDPCAKFTDVDRNAWYHEGVDYVLENGLMYGTSNTKFKPNDTLTRAMLVAVLYRLDGSPSVAGLTTPFKDLEKGSWYEDAVKWAYNNEIVAGTSDTTYSPDASVTREQLATFMFRYARFAGKDVSDRADLTTFPDNAKVSDWAYESMQWAVAAGLISGVSDGTTTKLAPKDKTTRAQVASILLRFSKMEIDDRDDIVILYTNDVHCGVDTSATSFGYTGLAEYKSQMQDSHTYVGLVDAGDFIQGEAIGSMSKGSAIVKIMNKVGYEVATLGNHEFDYGVDNIVNLMDLAEFPIVSANFKYTGPEGAENVADLAPYTIIEYGDVKVAYVGIATPESLSKSTPSYFQDEAGNWIYDFANDKEGTKLYESVQTAVDAARAEGADYVVALAHLGIDEGSAPWRSTDVIRETNGIDVMLDAHSHAVIAAQMVANKDGKEIILTSTGTKLANIGKLTITEDGKLRTELVTMQDFAFEGITEESSELAKETYALIQDIEAENAELLNTKVIDLANALTIYNPNRFDLAGNPVRAVRYQETNLGDVCADAYVYASGADIGWVNGGGVRADIEAGEVTYSDIIKVHPFGNELVIVKATGQQILDALEMSSRNVNINDEGLLEGECGGFLQVSGLKYTIFVDTPTSVVTDNAAMFEAVTGDRRVGDVKVYNKDTETWDPIDANKTYTLASHNYMLKEGGDGLNMFMKCEIIRDGGMLDNEVLINYFQSDLFAERQAAGMYDKWDGEGRITVTKGEAVQAAKKDDLNAAITEADKLNEADYDEGLWATFAEALAEAKRVTADPEATQAEVNAALAALNEAMEALKATTQYELTTVLKTGSQVIIYHPNSKKAMTAILNGTKFEGVEVTAADGVLTPDEEGKAAVFTVEFIDDANFLLKTKEGKYITSAPTGNGMSLEDEANQYSQWYLQILDANAGTVGIRCTNVEYNGQKNQALEYYNNLFTTYGWRDNNQAYIFQIYALSGENSHTDAHTTENRDAVAPTCTKEGYTAGVWCVDCGKYVEGHEKVDALGHKDENTDGKCDNCSGTIFNQVKELVDGDKILILNLPLSKALTGEVTTDSKENSVLAAEDLETINGQVALQAGAKAAFFDVEAVDGADGWFYLKLDGKYLTAGESGNTLTLETAPNAECSQWKLKVLNETLGTVGIISRKSLDEKNISLEYYAGNYTTYKWQDNNDAYIFEMFH